MKTQQPHLRRASHSHTLAREYTFQKVYSDINDATRQGFLECSSVMPSKFADGIREVLIAAGYQVSRASSILVENRVRLRISWDIQEETSLKREE